MSENTWKEAIKTWLRNPDEPDRILTKCKKIEIVFIIEAVNYILPRTEGVGDITLIKIGEIEAPVILPEKLHGIARRQLLALLRDHRDKNHTKLGEYLKQLELTFERETKKNEKEQITIGFTKAKEYTTNPQKWNCYIQPPGPAQSHTTDVGMDGFCPACTLFGTIIDAEKLYIIERNKTFNAETPIGIKSRITFDPAFAYLDKEKTTIYLTHNKVSEGTSWTGQSLFEECHVVPGTIFIGKATLEDVTEAELEMFLATLTSINKIGGRKSNFGGIRIHLIGIHGDHYETTSAYELARELKDANTTNIEEVKKILRDKLEKQGFHILNTEEFRTKLNDDELINKLWEHTITYDKKILEWYMKLTKNI